MMNFLRLIGRKGQMGRINDARPLTHEERVDVLQRRCNRLVFQAGMLFGAILMAAIVTVALYFSLHPQP